MALPRFREEVLHGGLHGFPAGLGELVAVAFENADFLVFHAAESERDIWVKRPVESYPPLREFPARGW